MNESGERVTVEVPEKEATALCKALRHNKSLAGLSLSCYGFVDRKGRRAVQVAVDKEDDRYDLYYKAESVGVDATRVANHAAKRILAHFVM